MLFPNVDIDSIPVSPQLRTIAKRLVEWEDPDPEVHMSVVLKSMMSMSR